MRIESSAETDRAGDEAFASMATHQLLKTPQNFELWFEYHLGRNLDLNRMIDIMLSNRRGIDARVMQDLYDRFFTTAREEHALRDASERVQETLKELSVLIDDGSVDAGQFGATLRETYETLSSGATPLSALLRRLLDEAQEMAVRTGRLGTRLRQSADKIETLERTLGDARKEATTDGLTGVANRRSFDTFLREAAGEAMNSGDNLSLLMIDVDHFKKFNDSWGHQIGDEVLRLVGVTLQKLVRTTDCAARYGGEEFAVVLRGTPLSGAGLVADRVRRTLEAQEFAVRETPRTLGRITVSVGASSYDAGEALSAWVQRADQALYRAKKEGRNRVVLC